MLSWLLCECTGLSCSNAASCERADGWWKSTRPWWEIDDEYTHTPFALVLQWFLFLILITDSS